MDRIRNIIVSDEHKAGTGNHHLTRLALLAALAGIPTLTLPIAAQAEVSIGIGVGITLAPPALPVYAQPVAPGPGYIWTPGYWAWGPNGYYWVDGIWLMPPTVGMLWTPGWWGWNDGFYRWHAGYWGPQVGFYGGINYGFGYFGIGYVGGYWRDRNFYYNRSVNNINVTNIHNVYVDKTVINNVHVNRISYNGGHGGVDAYPTSQQRSYAAQRHQTLPPMNAERHGASFAPQGPTQASPGSVRTESGRHGPNRGAPEGSNPQVLRNGMHPGTPDTLRTDRNPSPGAVPAHDRTLPAGSPQERMARPNDTRQQAPARPEQGFRGQPGNQAGGYTQGTGRPANMERPQEYNRAMTAPQPQRPEFQPREARQPQYRQPEVRQQEYRPQEYRQQEYRPRAEAPAREERGGYARPEHRGEAHSR